MVKPLKLTKTVTTGVLIASCITSTLPTHAFATQANAYADEFQAFVEGVENNKTDDAIADQAEQGTDQAAPVQPATPVEQTAPAPQTAAPASPEQTAPQGETVAPVGGVQAGENPSVEKSETDGKLDVAKKDEAVADKAVGNEEEVAPEASDKAEGVELAAETTAEVAPAEEIAEATAEKPQQTLGTFKELFPSESFRKVIRYNHIAWNDDDKLTREMLESVEDLNILYGSGPFVVGAKDAESLGYMINLKSFGFYGDQDGVDSWSVQDMDKLWASIGKMKNLEMLTLSDPTNASNGNINLNIPHLPKLGRLQIEGLTRSVFNADANSGKVFDGSKLNSKNLPSLVALRMSGTAIADWSSLSGFTSLMELTLSHNKIENLDFVRNMNKLTQLNISVNSITDFSALKPAFDRGIGSLSMDNQRVFKVGDAAVKLMGNDDVKEIPLTFKQPDGSVLPASSISLITNKGRVSLADAAALPEGITYDAKKGRFSITREAAKKLPMHSVGNVKGNMLAVEFNSQLSGGNSISGKVYVEVKVTDEIPTVPQLELNKVPTIKADNVTIWDDEDFDALAHATANDPETGKLAPKVERSTVKPHVPGTYEVTYSATDPAGAKVLKTIKVTINKYNLPVIKAEDKVVVEGSEFDPMDGVTATDHFGAAIVPELVKGKVDTSVPGDYKLTYRATDKRGKVSEKTITVTVNPRQLDLNAAPTFEGLSDKTIMLGDEFDPKAGVTAKDAEDGTVEFTVKGKVDNTKVGTYELVYTAKDSKGAAVTKVITVTVKQPVVGLNQPPTINAADVTIVQGETFDPMSGVTATDPEDGELKFTVTGTVDTEVYGEYELVYQAIDKDGAKATKTIKVIVLPRLVSLNAVPTIDAHSVAIVQGEAFDPMAGVTANDAEDGKLAVKLESGSVDTATPGEYILVYSATDSAGARVTKTITVKVVAKQAEAGKPQKPGKPQQTAKPQKPGKPNGTAQLPQTGDASMVAAGATGLMGVLALAAERLRRRRK